MGGRASGRAGFTLLELALVMAMIAVLVALAVPSMEVFVRRSQAAEPRALLPAIASAEQAYRRDHGKYRATAPSCTDVPRATVGSFDAHADGWDAIGIRPEGPIRYRYQVTLDGDSFRVVAEGDLNGDGRTSTFAIDGRTLSLSVQDELE